MIPVAKHILVHKLHIAPRIRAIFFPPLRVGHDKRRRPRYRHGGLESVLEAGPRPGGVAVQRERFPDMVDLSAFLIIPCGGYHRVDITHRHAQQPGAARALRRRQDAVKIIAGEIIIPGEAGARLLFYLLGIAAQHILESEPAFEIIQRALPVVIKQICPPRCKQEQGAERLKPPFFYCCVHVRTSGCLAANRSCCHSPERRNIHTWAATANCW